MLAGLMSCGLPAPGKAVAQNQEVPPAENVELVTSDRVQLHAVWLPGMNEKETVPIIMLHGWADGEGNDTDHASLLPMAMYLQKTYGYAVIVPDLRGHGKSNTYEGSDKEFNKDRWRSREITAMIEDIEACKKFLVQKNNAGELNIDLLSIVAEQELAMHSAIWTLRDWSYRPIAGRKQGQDVKAIAMIDPVRSFRGVNANTAYKDGMFTGEVGAGFPLLVASRGRDAKDAKNIYDSWKRSRRSLGDNTHLKYVRYRIEAQQRIVRVRDEPDKLLAQIIGEFFKQEVFDRKHDFRWQDRSFN